MGLLKKLQDENQDKDNPSGEAFDDPVLPPETDGFFSQPRAEGQRQFPRAGQAANEASAATSTEATAIKAEEAEKKKKEAEQKKDNEKDLPVELYMLAMLLRTNDWSLERSADPGLRAKGQVAWSVIESQIVSAMDAGYGVEVHQLWRQYAPQEHSGLSDVLAKQRNPSTAHEAADDRTRASLPALAEVAGLPEPYIPFYRHDPGETIIDVDATEVPNHSVARAAAMPFSEPYQSPTWAKRPAFHLPPNASGQTDAHQNPAHAGTGMSGDLLTKLLAAPFTLTAAAGSMVVNSLKAMGDKAKSFYVKNRVNGHAILASQLDQKAGEIESLTATLKKQGMGELIDAMRATGRPAREIFEGMKSGGSHQYFADRFNSLMKDEGFAETYGRLQAAFEDFGLKAARYAESGIELNLDYSDAIDRNLERISAATEGFVFKKDGVIKHLQELARQIGERISNLVNNLMGRLAPQ